MEHTQKINILFFTGALNIGGAEQNLLYYLDVADNNRFNLFAGSYRPGGLFESKIRDKGVRFIDCPLNPIKLFYLLKKNKMDIVQLYGLPVNVIARPIAKLAGCKVIATIRSIDSWRRWYHTLLDRLTSPYVDLWISNSEAGRKIAIQREKVDAKKIIVIHNGINIKEYQRVPEAQITKLKQRYGITENDIVIGEVANLREMKGHVDVIDAIPMIVQQYPNIKFFFAGEDQSNGKIKKYANAKGVNKHVIFAGYCDNIPEILSMFDIFILPSLLEGLPTSIIEAMTIGLPIIASNVGGIPELIDDGENGILIEPQSPQQLASSILYLLKNKDVARLMGERNIKRARQNHDIEEKARYFENIYKLAKK